MEFLKHQLDNGLEIVAERSADAYSMALGYFVRAGSRDETDQLSGVSHFLEHMTFKGTPRRTALDVNRELDEIGSESNAYTSEEQTVYYASMLPEYQERAVEILSDIMRPSLREDDFRTEKQVILEEIAKYEDQPPFGAHDRVMAAYFGRHPLGRSVLGSTASVSSLTADQMRAYFEQRYSPGNMALVASGNVDFDALVKQAERWCGDWRPRQVGRETPAAQPPGGIHVVHKAIASQEYGVLVSSGPASDDDARYAARVLSCVVGDGSGSRLYWELVEKGLVDYCEMAPYDFQGAGVMMTFLCCAPQETAANLQRIRKIHEQAQHDGVTAVELAQAQNKLCSYIVLRSERPVNRLFAVGSNWIQIQRYLTVKEVIQRFRSVTLDDISSLLAQHPLDNCTTMLVGPLTESSFHGAASQPS